MSELTPCNYCNLQRIKHRAKAQGKRVIITPHPVRPWTDAQDIYLTNEETPGKKRWVAWFAELPDHCVC